MVRFDEIKRKLQKLRTLDSELRIWGSKNHGHRLHAPIREIEVRRYETQYGIQLPKDYVDFLIGTKLGSI